MSLDFKIVLSNQEFMIQTHLIHGRKQELQNILLQTEKDK